jgi:assimilatory nitrate reductase catalytic subunit
MTSLEGRVLLRRRSCDPPSDVRTDIELISAIATGLGEGERFAYSSPEEVFEELRIASAGGLADYAGISYERIEAERGVYWPCPSERHPGTPRLFTDSFPTPTGRARFHPTPHRVAAEEPDGDFPLYLSTGRLLAHYQSGTQTRRVARLAQMAPAPVAQLHPATARRYALVTGGEVLLTTRRGKARFEVEVTPRIREDTVFLPFHWGGESSANRLTNDALDPVSRMPEFKVCAVRVERPSTNGRSER